MNDTVFVWIGLLTVLWCALLVWYATVSGASVERDGRSGLMIAFAQMLTSAGESARKAGSQAKASQRGVGAAEAEAARS